MRIAWHFAQNDIDAVRSIVADHRNHVIVRDRIARNLSASKPAVDRQRFWRALTMALLTTQQQTLQSLAELGTLEWTLNTKDR